MLVSLKIWSGPNYTHYNCSNVYLLGARVVPAVDDIMPFSMGVQSISVLQRVLKKRNLPLPPPMMLLKERKSWESIILTLIHREFVITAEELRRRLEAYRNNSKVLQTHLSVVCLIGKWPTPGRWKIGCHFEVPQLGLLAIFYRISNAMPVNFPSYPRAPPLPLLAMNIPLLIFPSADLWLIYLHHRGMMQL